MSLSFSSSLSALSPWLVDYAHILMGNGVGFCQNAASLDIFQAMSFGFVASTAFVGSLYGLVPRRVRQLARDDPRQIQWRTFATGCVCLGAAGFVPLLCQGGGSSSSLQPASLSTFQAVGRVLAHVAILYTGPLVQSWIEVYVYTKQQQQEQQQQQIDPSLYLQTCYAAWFESLVSDLRSGGAKRWIRLRNFFWAPLLEEFMFRGLIVPVLAATSLSRVAVCWISPLFFGIAHVHHAAQRWRQGERRFLAVLVPTLFQFTYTTLFGAYAAYAYLQTKSLYAVTVAHSFCNWMGLPNLEFVSSKSRIHSFQTLLWAAHVAGLTLFLWDFSKGMLLPA